jgi:hypothetical protein
MDRRYFLKSLVASTGVILAGSSFKCQPSEDLPDIFSTGSQPEKLWAISVSKNMDWHYKIFLTNLQGLINRKQTRIYLVSSKPDEFWLNYYKDQFNVRSERVEDTDQFIRTLCNEISGYIVYDPELPHSMNLASTMGSINNAVPISKDLEEYVSQLGLKRIDDLSGRWKDMYQAYEWAFENLLPRCNQKIMAQICVHHPHWPTRSYRNRDYVIAHNILSVDISSSERDKRDYYLLRKYYEAYPEGAVIMGWHCVRDKEHEAIALSSEYGHYGMCSMHTNNLTVHSSIRPTKPISYKQRSIGKEDLKVEDKVYIAYMTTDGDATWFVQNLIETDWANPQHGTFKYNWGFLPMAYDLMPGMVHYYLQNMQPNDYFVAGPAGATYTYPHLHPNPQKFLRLSDYYMKKCGLTTVHMTNWNDRDWWQEVEVPGYHTTLRENLPDCVGYVRGMGESAFEKHYIAGGKPFLFCGEGIHRGNDIYQTMKDFIDACPNRPLFIYNLVNHTMPMDQIKSAMDRFPKDTVELVHLDELLILVEKAFEQGKISEELYPEKEGLKNILAREARQAWPSFIKNLLELQLKYKNGEEAYAEQIRETAIGLEEVIPGNFLAFATIWNGMRLVKLSLESKGIYVNHKPTANKQFLNEFRHISDVELIKELQDLWDSWHQKSVDFKQARILADRLLKITEHINNQHFNNGRG